MVPCNPKAPFYVALWKHAMAALDFTNDPDETAHRPQGRFVLPVEAEESSALIGKENVRDFVAFLWND